MSMRDDDHMSGLPLRPQVIAAEDSRPADGGPVSPRVIMTAQSGRIVQKPPSRASAAANSVAKGNWLKKLLWSGLGLALLAWLAVDLYLWVVTAFSYSMSLGWVAVCAVATAIFAAGGLIGREMRSYFALKEVEAHQELLSVDGVVQLPASAVQKAIREVIAGIPREPESTAAVEAFQRQVQRHHSAEQQVRLLSQAVMSPLDRRSEAMVRRASARAFGITAISPTAVTDAVFFIATSVRMVRQIAACYGHRPNALATVHLLRRLIVDAGRVGAVDLAGAALTQHFGGAIAERVAAGAAESLYATQRMARLGLATMALCRPVPFRPDEVPGVMSSLVGNLFARRSDPSSAE